MLLLLLLLLLLICSILQRWVWIKSKIKSKEQEQGSNKNPPPWFEVWLARVIRVLLLGLQAFQLIHGGRSQADGLAAAGREVER